MGIGMYAARALHSDYLRLCVFAARSLVATHVDPWGVAAALSRSVAFDSCRLHMHKSNVIRVMRACAVQLLHVLMHPSYVPA